MTVSTASEHFDTVLAVYTGNSVGGLTQVACNDDAANTLQSSVQFAAQAGASYRIQVGGYNAASGNVALSVAVAAQDADPRQEGPLVVGGNLSLGGTATIAVTVKNYGGVATPLVNPFVDGTEPGGPVLARRESPASAGVQPRSIGHVHGSAGCLGGRLLEHDRRRAVEYLHERAAEGTPGQRPEPAGQLPGADGV